MKRKRALYGCAALLVCAGGFWLAGFGSGREIHVDAARPHDSGDGKSWATAKRNIQAAIDEAKRGDVVLVAEGVYRPIRTRGRAIVIRSVAGSGRTVIDGGGGARCATLSSPWSAAVQPRLFNALQKAWFYYLPCMIPAMGSGSAPPRFPSAPGRRSRLVGFTLRNGFAGLGGGAHGGTLVDCIVVSNRAELAGGGVWGGALEGCVVADNRAGWMGGGVWGGSSTNCALEGNAAEFGGGAWGGRLAACSLLRNQAEVGGGAAAAQLTDVVVSGNVAWKYASGVHGGWLENCRVSGNRMKRSDAENRQTPGAALSRCDIEADAPQPGAGDLCGAREEAETPSPGASASSGGKESVGRVVK